MFIDFHTHIFPDKVAAKAIPKLSGLINQKPSMDGTYDDLRASMDRAGIDISVVLPVVTAPSQFDSIVRYACDINDRYFKDPSLGIYSLAGIHPHSTEYTEQLTLLKNMGFKGIKLHPDYQGVVFNDIRYKRILDKATELDMVVVTHTGYDPYSPNRVYCTPQMIVEVLDEVKPAKLVLAHMGNNRYYTDVEKLLIGRDVYLDTAYTISTLQPARLLNMIRDHGADKVLFASDAPWSDQAKDVRILKNLGLTDEEFKLLSHQNAQKLLDS